MAKAKITEILTGYERADKKTRLLGKKFHSHKLSGTVTVKTKRFLDSRLMRGSRELTHLFSYAKGKTYGLVPVLVMLVSALAMVLSGVLVKLTKKRWISDYALPVSLVIGMASAIPITAWLG